MARDTLPDMSLAEQDLPDVGDLFAERYRIEAQLGRGSRGWAYRAHDVEVGEVLALDLFQVFDDASIERVRRQVRLARRVTHRNVARTYDLGEHAGLRYLTTEYVDGVSVGDRIAQGTGAAEAVAVGLQIAAGLATMHAADVIHRELTPSCILIESGGRVVITDFSTACTSGEPSDGDPRRGNPLYLPPELLEPGTAAADARTDIYALGLILSAMLIGRPLDEGPTLVELREARLTREYPDPEALDRLPPALREPLRRCLARDPAERFASVSEFAAALVEASTPETADTTDELSRDRDLTQRSTSQLGRTTASSPAQSKALAVLPFRYRGPPAESYVADALLDELTDVLAMTRGLRVSGSGATTRFAGAGDRDPRLLGTELAVDVVVDGSIQLAGKRLRIAARLLDVHTGFQLWSERFDGELGDVFDLQDKLGQRIAEALRVELELISHGGLDDPEALESYLRARQAKLHWRMSGSDGAVAHYRRVLERAPSFRPAIAGAALALMRGWFMPGERDDEHDWAGEAKRAVERAMLEAPDFPESRIAMASWLVQAGDYRGAAEHLREALRIAPTCALAHEYLGRLQTEAAQPDKGLRHLELALELDPALVWCHADIARYRALQGDLDGYREHMQRLLAQTDRLHVAAHLLEMRVGAWFRDVDQIRRGLAQIDPDSSDEAIRSMRAYGPPLLQSYDPEALARFHAQVLEGAQNGRLRTLLFQLWAEQSAFWSDHARTLAHLEAAADLALVDLAWLDGCPLFDFVRAELRFVQVRARVRTRCEAIWGS